MHKLTMRQEVELTNKIKEKGLWKEARKHKVYYYRLFKKGMITKQEWIYNTESVLIIFGS